MLPNQLENLVFFDLETTGLGVSCEIIQLAAVCGPHSLSLYSVPHCRLQPRAAAVTGFRVRKHKLYLHHKPVLTNSLREVLVSFIAFLRTLQQPLVIGHNIRNFDCRVLAKALDECDLRTEFVSVISGCLDTLPLARELLKDAGVQSFSQEALVRTVLGVSYKAHDALEDVRALQMLYTALEAKPEQVVRHTFLLKTTAGTLRNQEAAALTLRNQEAAALTLRNQEAAALTLRNQEAAALTLRNQEAEH